FNRAAAAGTPGLLSFEGHSQATRRPLECDDPDKEHQNVDHAPTLSFPLRLCGPPWAGAGAESKGMFQAGLAQTGRLRGPRNRFQRLSVPSRRTADNGFPDATVYASDTKRRTAS